MFEVLIVRSQSVERPRSWGVTLGHARERCTSLSGRGDGADPPRRRPWRRSSGPQSCWLAVCDPHRLPGWARWSPPRRRCGASTAPGARRGAGTSLCQRHRAQGNDLIGKAWTGRRRRRLRDDQHLTASDPSCACPVDHPPLLQQHPRAPHHLAWPHGRPRGRPVQHAVGLLCGICGRHDRASSRHSL